MLVEVFELYSRGVRRSREEIRDSTPVRGVLSLDRCWTWESVERERAPVHAFLMPAGLQPLFKARVLFIRNYRILIHGSQRAAEPFKNREHIYDQRWWCKVVTADSPATTERSQPAQGQCAADQPGQRSRAAADA